MNVFADWGRLGTVVVLTAAMFFGVVLALRLGGKRTLSQLNAFDLVVTVAIGSVVATSVLSKDTALVEGLVAIFTLVALQTLSNYLTSRFRMLRRIFRASPTILVYRGDVKDDAMASARISTEEVEQAVRQKGHGGLDDVEAVVLESDGSLSVLIETGRDEAEVLKSASNYPGQSLGEDED